MMLSRYRRGLLRPLSDLTADELREGDLSDPADVEHYKIEDAQYEKYFQLFNDLDRICGVAGEDFGVEEIEIERLDCVCKTLKTYNRRSSDGKLDVVLDTLLDRLWGICVRAKDAGQSVFFVL